MTEIQKVTDPARIVTDHAMLAALVNRGIDMDYVELWHDYAPRSRGKGWSPYARVYRDIRSGNRFMDIGGLPMVDAFGQGHELNWVDKNSRVENGNNIFHAVMEGGDTRLVALSDQPNGARMNDEVTFHPQLFLDGVEILPVSDTPHLLETDPVNNNYHNNVLEWDYGVCLRRIRIIEGRFLGSWVFIVNPHADVRIRYNQAGKLKLRFQYSQDNDTEFIPESYFDAPMFGYPVTISDSATFYPDAHPETSSVDGRLYYSNDPSDWAPLHDAANATGGDDTTDYLNTYIFSSATSNKWVNIWRSILLFDTSSLPDAAVISAVTASLYGYFTYGANFGSTLNWYSSNPASNVALALADFDQVGTTAFATAIAALSFNVGTPGISTDWTFNAAGIAAISKTGVTKLSFRENHDATNTAPTWESYKGGGCVPWSSDKGTGYQPKLVITYSDGEPKTSGDTGSGIEVTSAREIGAAEAGAGLEVSLAGAAVSSGDWGNGTETGGLLKSLSVADGGSGSDALKVLTGKSGSDMRLRGHRGQVGLPHKEVNL